MPDRKSRRDPRGSNTSSAALSQLRSAIELAERARRADFEDAVERAEFFMAYDTAFDLLVHFHVRAGDLKGAIATAERCRNLTLLDQRRALNVTVEEHVEPERAVDQFLAKKEPLLYYYVGRQKAYVFFRGGQGEPLSIAPLRTPTGKDAYLSDIEQCIKDLREELAEDPKRDRDREKLARASHILMPERVRDFLRAQRDLGAKHVTVVPHRFIAQFPLEALAFDQSGSDRYVGEICPPLAYVPSLTMWTELSRSKLQAPVALDHPQIVSVGVKETDSEVSRINLTAYKVTADSASAPAAGDPLPPLPNAEEECREISSQFTKPILLLASDATESRLRKRSIAPPASCTSRRTASSPTAMLGFS